MNKKGQVTVFIIVGIIILAVLGGSYYAFNKIKESIYQKELEKASFVPIEVRDIKTYMESCVKKVAENGVRLIGIQGGYVVLPPIVLETNFSTISYGSYNGKKLLPSIKKIQEELNLYIELFLPLCFDESNFPDFKITTKIVDAQTKIKSDSVSAIVNYPVLVSKDSATYDIQSKYTTEIPVRLSKIHKVVNEIIDNEADTIEVIDLTYLTNLNYDISILPYSNNILVYSITDPNSKINGVPYTFTFDNRLR